MDNYLGEIRAFAFGRIPRNWAPCNGQTLPINQNQPLFSLLGTTYGGDGITNFQLPNLQGRAALHFGVYNGTSPATYPPGTVSGSEKITLIPTNLPVHTHSFLVAPGGGTSSLNAGTAGTQYLAALPEVPQIMTENMVPYTPQLGGSATTLHPNSISATGGNQPHENRMPYLPILLCIALTGIFPSRQ